MNAQIREPSVLRQPPCAIEAEQNVLGGLLLVPEALSTIADWLRAEDFYRREHRLIFGAITALVARSEVVDAITLGDWFARNGDVASIGGVAYLAELASNTASVANLVAHAEIVLEQSRLRKAIEIGSELTGAAFQRRDTCEAVVAKATQALAELQTSRLRGGLKPSRELMRGWFAELSERHQRGDAITGMPTPWTQLDALTHGLQAGDLIVIAGRPNMGKTVMGVQLAVHAALKLQRRTAVFSLEMTAAQVLNRAVSLLASTPHDWMMSPQDEDPWTSVSETASMLSGSPLLIDDSPALNADQISARAQRAHLQAPIGLIVVDHLHEMALSGRTSSERAHELGEAAGKLKKLGKDFGCPVVALAQLNRDLLGRNDKHPVMSDLRASGDIEQKADLILFLHREDYYDKRTHLQGVVDVEIGKGRNVKTGERVQLRNRFDVMRMDDWDGELPLPPSKTQTNSKKRNSFAPDPVSEAYRE